jgi:hypothetical protein
MDKEMTAMLSVQSSSELNSSTKTLQLRHVIARSNHFMVAALPSSWIFWYAWPHEIWHFLAARALGLRASLVPGATLFERTSRWKSIAVLMAPATVGLVWPLAWLPVLQWASHYPGSVNWALLVVSVLGWWSGCVGDFIDSWLLVAHQENKTQHQARMQRMVDRYKPELTREWQTALQEV